MAQVINMLPELRTAELSLVRRGANRKRYATTKSESNVKINQAVLSVPAEGEEQLVASLKSAGANADQIEAATAMFRMQKGYADVVTPETLALIAKASKKDDEMDGDDEDDEEDAAYKAKKAKKTKKSNQTGIEPGFAAAKKSADGSPDLSALSPETRAQVEAVFKSNNDLANQVSQLAGVVTGLVEQNSTSEFVAKAEKEFSHIPGSPAEIGAVLKSAHAANPELGKGLEKLFAQVNGIVAKSAMFTSLGVSGQGGGAGGSAWDQIQQLAGSLTMKSESGKELTKEQKVEHVITKTAEGRALYRSYLGENPAQRSKYGF